VVLFSSESSEELNLSSLKLGTCLSGLLIVPGLHLGGNHTHGGPHLQILHALQGAGSVRASIRHLGRHNVSREILQM
jgi:hypothetical protein